MIGLLAVASAAAGSLAGTVRGPDGAGVGGATITVSSRSAVVVGTTDSAGAYVVDGLPAAAYRVHAIPPSYTNLGAAWAPGARLSCDGDRIDVPERGAVDGVDIAVAVAGTIRGRILLPDGTPAASATLTAVADYVDARAGVTEADGTFVLGGVLSGDIRLVIDAEGAPLQYLGGAYQPTQVAPLLLDAGDVVDVGVVELLPGITVGGTVYVDGRPAPGGTVTAILANVLLPVPIGPDGRWEVSGLPPGEATARAEVDGRATTYYPDDDRPRTSVALTDGERFDQMDLVLPPESVVTGRLVGDRDWSRVSVALGTADGDLSFPPDTLEPDGTFRFDGLHGGDYILSVAAGEVGGRNDVWRGADGAPVEIEVPPEAFADVGEVPVPDGARLAGRVVDAASGAPVVAAAVVAGRSATGVQSYAITDADGRYHVDGLGPDTYDLSVTASWPCPTDDGWVSLYWPDTPNPVFSSPLVVTGPAPITWDPALPPDHDHDAMDDGWEDTHGLDPTVDDGALDPDDDGFTNHDEYLFGTNPNDPPVTGCGCGSRQGALGLSVTGLWGLVALAGRRRRQ